MSKHGPLTDRCCAVSTFERLVRNLLYLHLSNICGCNNGMVRYLPDMKLRRQCSVRLSMTFLGETVSKLGISDHPALVHPIHR